MGSQSTTPVFWHEETYEESQTAENTRPISCVWNTKECEVVLVCCIPGCQKNLAVWYDSSQAGLIIPMFLRDINKYPVNS